MSKKKPDGGNPANTSSMNNFDVYIVKFHGDALKAIKDEFVRQLQTGIRRAVFYIDVDEIFNTPRRLSNRVITPIQEMTYNTKMLTTQVIIEGIRDFSNKYDLITKRINEEKSFNLTEYWEKYLTDTKGAAREVAKGRKSNTDKRKSLKSASNVKMTTRRNQLEVIPEAETEIICNVLDRKLHNRIGQPELLSKIKFILDEPTEGRLVVILLGNIDEDLIMELLYNKLSVLGIVHFTPVEGNYDIWLGNKRVHKFIVETLNKIEEETFFQRFNSALKPVGVFMHELPIISICLANKYAEDIYRELVWTVYDISNLKENYDNYYIKPFNVINVAMPDNVDMHALLNQVQNLILHSHYQNCGYPSTIADSITILAYLDALLNTCDNTITILNRKQIALIASTKRSLNEEQLTGSQLLLVNSYRSAFNSISRSRKTQRILIDDKNELLCNMLLYMNKTASDNFFKACLDYDMFKPYLTYEYIFKKLLEREFDESNDENLQLPPYAKVYLTDESSTERLLYLLNEFDNYEILNLKKGNRLYTFERKYNKIETIDELYYIPTRLCFRDFTIFQKEEFLADANLPPNKLGSEINAFMRNSKTGASQVRLSRRRSDNVNQSLLIRPRSLQARFFNDTYYTSRKSIYNKLQNSPDRRQSILKYVNVDRDLSGSGPQYGLPPNHRLLTGYNLEDIRQEIKFKRYHIYFDEGSAQLYMEHWCFDVMNITMKLTLHDVTLHLSSIGRYQDGGISNSLLLEASNRINIRVLNEQYECAKLVMHYPNGLSIYHHNTYAVQEWQPENTYTEDIRRIFTPQGCVIVFKKMLDLIIIMRNNGEVYRLYQYDFTTEEEEHEEISELQRDISASEFQSNEGNMPQSQSVQTVRKSSKKSANKRGKNGDKQQKSSKNNDNCNSFSSLSNSNPENMRASIADELQYLEHVMKLYSLSYVNLKLTTSRGHIYNLHKNGKISNSPCLPRKEWHNYFLNESYCVRADGVRFIWSENNTKVYHQDGTVIITEYEEFNIRNYEDEYERLISESSSHSNLSGFLSGNVNMSNRHNKFSAEADNQSGVPTQSDLRLNLDFLNENQEEHYPSSAKYTDYVAFRNLEILIQHHDYAAINFLLSSLPEFCVMEISGYNNIRMCMMHMITPYESEPNNQNDEFSGQDNFSSNNTGNTKTSKSTRSMINIREMRNKETKNYFEMHGDGKDFNKLGHKLTVFVKVSFGDDLHFVMDPNGCDIFTKLQIEDEAGKEVFEDIMNKNLLHVMRFEYNEKLLDVFKYIANDIKTVKCATERTLKLQYLEHISENCQIRGFEFIQSPPHYTGSVYAAGNYIMEMKPFQTYHELLQNPYELYDHDMAKFSQYPCRARKQQCFKTEQLAENLSVSVVVNIPSSHRSLLTVHKFLSGFDELNFKDMKERMKRQLNSLLHPEISEIARVFWSRNNWRLKHLEHELRLFKETKRIGLYQAMLKHKQFPNYMHYVERYKEQAAKIDFFDFMTNKCQGQPVREEEVYFPPCPQPKSRRKGKSKSPRRRKQGIQMPLTVPVPPVILKDNIWCRPSKPYL